jgi:hypothetical protein
MKLINIHYSPRFVFLHFRPNIFLNNLFLKSLSLSFSPKAREQVSHRYSTTGKIIDLYILISIIWYETGGQKILDWITASITQLFFNLLYKIPT